MKTVAADLHLHSSYARATSRDLNFDTLTKWAKFKGINLLSSADFTHPVWFAETKTKLKDQNNGFFSYQGFSFVLGAEVSCIFSQGGRLRRVHLLLYVPTLKAAEKVNQELGKRGKLGSDGRPILGLPAKTVLEILLEASEDSIMIPAHAWTPWFGVLGQNGGFDSLEECFGDLTKYIYAVETGLSSDPSMNWRIKQLDNLSIVSFSDAHSAPKMGRELTIFNMESNYTSLKEALKKQRIDSTIEFFPEEGKYHFNGHRNCNFKEIPSETLKRGLLCPICKKPLTIGVMHRVEQLAEKERDENYKPKNRGNFTKLVPLQEVIAEVLKLPVTSNRVKDLYFKLIENFGTELAILTEIEANTFDNFTQNSRFSEAIEKMRNGDIFIDPGYDGVYGQVHIWPEESQSKKPSEKIQQKLVSEPENLDKNQLELFKN